MKQVKARKDQVSGRSNTGVEQWLKGTKNLTVYQGVARFESNNSVRVNDDLLTADKVFINVGGHAFVPEFEGLDKIDYMTNETIMDVDPPLGRVGMTEAQAKASGRNVLVGKRPMTQIGRAVEQGQTDGFMKILVDADSKEILGAAIIGLTGDEVVHSITDIMYAKVPYTVIQKAVHIHPTVSELIPTMLGDLKPLV